MRYDAASLRWHMAISRAINLCDTVFTWVCVCVCLCKHLASRRNPRIWTRNNAIYYWFWVTIFNGAHSSVKGSRVGKRPSKQALNHLSIHIAVRTWLQWIYLLFHFFYSVYFRVIFLAEVKTHLNAVDGIGQSAMRHTDNAEPQTVVVVGYLFDGGVASFMFVCTLQRIDVRLMRRTLAANMTHTHTHTQSNKCSNICA